MKSASRSSPVTRVKSAPGAIARAGIWPRTTTEGDRAPWNFRGEAPWRAQLIPILKPRRAAFDQKGQASALLKDRSYAHGEGEKARGAWDFSAERGLPQRD